MCDDIEATLAELRDKGVEIARDVSDQGWGAWPPSACRTARSCPSTSPAIPRRTQPDRSAWPPRTRLFSGCLGRLCHLGRLAARRRRVRHQLRSRDAGTAEVRPTRPGRAGDRGRPRAGTGDRAGAGRGGRGRRARAARRGRGRRRGGGDRGTGPPRAAAADGHGPGPGRSARRWTRPPGTSAAWTSWSTTPASPRGTRPKTSGRRPRRDPGRQPQGDVPGQPGRRAHHDQPGVGEDHQHRLPGRARSRCRENPSTA